MLLEKNHSVVMTTEQSHEAERVLICFTSADEL